MKVFSLRTRGATAALAGAIAATLFLCLFSAVTAHAQPLIQANGKQPMYVTADEMVYDEVRKTSSAVDSVKIYYGDSTLDADRVVYDQSTGKVFAYGNVRLNDKGSVYQADHMVLSDDFRDGFVQSLLVEGADRTRFAAQSATRTDDGKVVIFDKGVYTACAPCLENPQKPPLWQVKAARIIHDQGTKTIHYEDARIEFFGKPIAWLPFFSHPDGTVKRKSGFLMPSYMNSTEYGFGARIPYYWAIRPNMDVTVATNIYSEQGIMPDVEFRHRTMEGAYSIRAAGIFQQSPENFPSGNEGQQNDFRGALTSKGDFRINDFWTWGWDANILSDKWVLDDYDMWGANWTEALTTAHLTGIGDRNYFELRGYYFYGLSWDDVQEQLPVVGVWDYNYVHDKPVLGGEWAVNVNLTNTWRDTTDYEPLSASNVSLTDGGALVSPIGLGGRNLSCADLTSDCAIIGMGGTYTRLSVDTSWRREFIDPVGQVWTPFAYARGDVMYRNPDDTIPAGLINTEEETITRGMIGAGLEYRFPFVATSSIGTHILEPIAQVILRPDEQEIGNVPNEDAQSLFFDTSTLFSWDKFSGYDRVEGGGRANVGLQYTLNLNSGGFVQVLLGQSYHLFGLNSFAATDMTETGRSSGLEEDVSDYVASAYWKVSQRVAFSSRFRLDEDNLNANAIELESTFKQGPVLAGITYGRYEAQPQFGFERAEGVVGSTKLNVTDNHYVLAAARYNIETEKFDRAMVGAGYLDECFSIGLNYAVDFSENGNDDPVHKVFFRMTLRTLGEYNSSVNVSNLINRQEDMPTP